jgi:hypothetical protein
VRTILVLVVLESVAELTRVLGIQDTFIRRLSSLHLYQVNVTNSASNGTESMQEDFHVCNPPACLLSNPSLRIFYAFFLAMD